MTVWRFNRATGHIERADAPKPEKVEEKKPAPKKKGRKPANKAAKVEDK